MIDIQSLRTLLVNCRSDAAAQVALRDLILETGADGLLALLERGVDAAGPCVVCQGDAQTPEHGLSHLELRRRLVVETISIQQQERNAAQHREGKK